jgi:hypothetical protein
MQEYAVHAIAAASLVYLGYWFFRSVIAKRKSATDTGCSSCPQCATAPAKKPAVPANVEAQLRLR